MIDIEGVSFAYKTKKRMVIDDFSLNFEQGKVYGLLGKNGVGKSTLLYLMTGLLTPKSGRVVYNGIEVRKRLPQTLRDMFIVPEEFALPTLSLTSYIELNSPFYPNFSKVDMIKYLHFFDMDIDVDLSALSMGQKKKVFMSFALATNVSLLMMDEPTNGLDIPGKSQFRKLIASGMNDERTIIISTHQVRDIDRILDHVIIMNNSKALLNESIANISSKLLFLESDDSELASRAIFSMPSVKGNYLLLPNDNSEETEVNLELLFNALLSNSEMIHQLFNQKTEYNENR